MGLDELNIYTVGSGIVKLFLLATVGYALHRYKFIDSDFLEQLSRLIVWVFAPALIFSKFTSEFNPAVMHHWWILPLLGMCVCFFGLGVSWCVARLNPHLKSVEKEFIGGCAFQNCGYLPMSLVVFAFSSAVANVYLIYIFLFILGFNVVFWTVLPVFLSRDKKATFRLENIINPPLIAVLVSFLWLFLMGKGRVPAVLLGPIRFLGQSTFPLAMLTLGGFLHSHKAYRLENWPALAVGVFTKLLLIPAVAFPLILAAPLSKGYKFLVFLETIMPSAVSLVVVGQYAGANIRFLSGLILYSHIFCIITIPLWIYGANLIGIGV